MFVIRMDSQIFVFHQKLNFRAHVVPCAPGPERPGNLLIGILTQKSMVS
jgi:hypothetical protein